MMKMMMSYSPASSYWEERYKLGGTSGSGSVGRSAEWKWSVIEKYAGKVESVIDVGCGDLSFWRGREIPSSYFGIDISSTIIEKNRAKWGPRFACSSADTFIELPKAEVVLCLDVLFHIMDEGVYAGILENLARYSKRWIFIYTWAANPFESLVVRLKLLAASLIEGRFADSLRRLWDTSSDGKYERYREFSRYLFLLEEAGFSLVSQEIDPTTNKFGAMYVFSKEKEGRRREPRSIS